MLVSASPPRILDFKMSDTCGTVIIVKGLLTHSVPEALDDSKHNNCIFTNFLCIKIVSSDFIYFYTIVIRTVIYRKLSKANKYVAKRLKGDYFQTKFAFNQNFQTACKKKKNH